MRSLLERARELVVELQRRRVYRVVGLYAASAYVVLQVTDLTLPALGFSPRIFTYLVIAAAVGFPVAVAFGWAFDLTAEGLKAEASSFRGRHAAVRSVMILGVGVLGLGLGWGSWRVLAGSADAMGVAAVAGPVETPPAPAPPPLDPRRIAVLYLDDLSPEGDLGYLAAGFTEMILHELVQVPTLDVVSRNGVRPYRQQDVGLDSIVRALGVGSVVEGSVSRSGETVRVTIQLIDGATLTHLSSRVVDARVQDLFALQDSVTSEVVRGLRARIGSEIRRRERRGGTTDVDAWIAFRQALERHEAYKGFRESDREAAWRAVMAADSLLARAEALDPTWPAPIVERARGAYHAASLRGPLPGSVDEAWAATALAHAERAQALAADFAEAWAVSGLVRHRLSRTGGVAGAALEKEAEADLRRAVGLDAGLATAWWTLSEVLINQSRFAEAVEASERALVADAFLELESNVLHGRWYAAVQVGPTEEAMHWCRQGRRRFPGELNFVTCRLWELGSFPQVEPDLDHAWALYDTLLSVAPVGTEATWRAYGRMYVAQTAARAGLADSARAIVRLARGDELPAPLAYYEARVHVLLGEEEEATRDLRLYLTYDPDTTYIAEDWWFEELRGHEGFVELMGSTHP